MKKSIVALFTRLYFVLFNAQITDTSRVANFSNDKSLSKNFESFSFQETNGKPAEIIYAYGENYEEIKLKHLGKTEFNGKKAFKVMFPNKLVLYIVPNSNNTISVYNKSKSYNKTFNWQYEGPIDGIGTFCEPCVDDKESIALLRNVYLK